MIEPAADLMRDAFRWFRPLLPEPRTVEGDGKVSRGDSRNFWICAGVAMMLLAAAWPRLSWSRPSGDRSGTRGHSKDRGLRDNDHNRPGPAQQHPGSAAGDTSNRSHRSTPRHPDEAQSRSDARVAAVVPFADLRRCNPGEGEQEDHLFYDLLEAYSQANDVDGR